MAQQCKVWIDKTLVQSTKGIGELITNMEKSNIATIIEKLPVENSIFWTRSDTTFSKEDKNKVLFLNHLNNIDNNRLHI